MRMTFKWMLDYIGLRHVTDVRLSPQSVGPREVT